MPRRIITVQQNIPRALTPPPPRRSYPFAICEGVPTLEETLSQIRKPPRDPFENCESRLWLAGYLFCELTKSLFELACPVLIVYVLLFDCLPSFVCVAGPGCDFLTFLSSRLLLASDFVITWNI